VGFEQVLLCPQPNWKSPHLSHPPSIAAMPNIPRATIRRFMSGFPKKIVSLAKLALVAATGQAARCSAIRTAALARRAADGDQQTPDRFSA
jgi:hypothetical protein